MSTLRVSSLVVVCLSLACGGGQTVSPETPGGADGDAAADVATASASGDAAMSPAIVSAAATAAGVEKMKIRFNADGAVVKQALYHGDPSAIPEPVRKLAEKKFPGGKTVHYETEHYADLGDVFEVEVDTADGRRCEVAAKADGTEVYEECRVDPAALPDPIKKAIEAATPGGKIEEAETKKGPGVDEVTVEVESGGRDYYLRIGADGTLLEKLVRIPAIVEVPAG